ncbi:unnamed protein product, partial [Adineta steineri]
ETEPPRGRIFLYLRISNRKINSVTNHQTIFVDTNKKELFNINIPRSTLLYRHLSTYGYIDSVNIIAEGYPTFKYYDFILKTDIDVFITKQFAKFIPFVHSGLLVGRGGYSSDFNNRRLARIARDMNWTHQGIPNIGST